MYLIININDEQTFAYYEGHMKFVAIVKTEEELKEKLGTLRTVHPDRIYIYVEAKSELEIKSEHEEILNRIWKLFESQNEEIHEPITYLNIKKCFTKEKE